MRILLLVVLAGAAYGVKRWLDAAKRSRRAGETRERLSTWEGEGGAVPVDTNRTAALTPAQSAVPGENPGKPGV